MSDKRVGLLETVADFARVLVDAALANGLTSLHFEGLAVAVDALDAYDAAAQVGLEVVPT